MEDYLCQEQDCVDKRTELRQCYTQRAYLAVSTKHHVSEADVDIALDSLLRCNGADLKYLTLACGLSDKTGLKIAQLIAVSNDLETCDLPFNNFTGTTIAAIFQALWTNTSLRKLSIYRINFCMWSSFVDSRLTDALWFNSGIRPDFTFIRSEYGEYDSAAALRPIAAERGHPPLQFLLYRYLVPATRHAKITR